MIRRFIFLLTLSLLPCTTVGGQAPQSMDHAWQLAANGQRSDAIELLKQMVAANPGNADARLLLGSLLMEEGQRSESLEQLTAAVRLRPRSAEAANTLGEAYNRFNDIAAARAAFEKAVALNPNYGIAQSNLGQILLATGQTTAAADHLDRAIRLLGHADDAADARYLRAKVYAAGGKPRDAATQLEEAVAIRPKFAEAWSDLGQARRTLLDDPGALTAYERAVESNPEDAVAQYRLGAEYLRQNQSALAVTHLRKAYQLNATDQSTLNSLQAALRQNGKPEEADRVKKALADLLRDKDRINQNHLSAVKLNNEGATLEKTGNLQAALANYHQALDLYPEHVGLRVNYAVLLLRLGQWTDGLNQLHEAVLRDPKNDQIKAALHDALSQAPPNAIPRWDQPLR